MEKLNKDTILDTIKKLMNVSEQKGSTPGEVANAMAAAQSLLAKHGLSMLDVERHKLDKEGFSVKKDTFKSSFQSLPDYASLLAIAICKGFDTKLVTGRDYATGKVLMHFIGQEVDTTVAKYLYVRTCDELWAMASKEARARNINGRAIGGYRASFICGAAEVIGDRLKKQREGDIKTDVKIGALMVLKNELIEDKMSEFFPNLRSKTVRGSYGNGHDEGRAAGRRIDLTLNGVQQNAGPRNGGYING